MPHLSTLVTTTSGNRSPISYIDYLKFRGFNGLDAVDLFNEYNDYVHNWFENAKADNEDTSAISKSLYRNFLKEIALSYTTDEEKRFLVNINYKSDTDLDIILPFFVKKIKEITKYYSRHRHSVGDAKIKHNLKGSNFGTKTLIKHLILDLITTESFTSQYPNTNFPSVSSVSDNTEILIDELYDDYQLYFNSTADKQYDTEEIDSRLYLDLKSVISELIGDDSPSLLSSDTLEALITNTSSNIEINVTNEDISDVDDRRFLGATKSEDELAVLQSQKLFEKHAAQGYLYLSAGSTSTSYVTGSLFEPSNGAANLLNELYSNHATNEQTDKLYRLSDRGRLFAPDKLGLLKFEAVNLVTKLDTSKIVPNTLYVYPDPSAIESDLGPNKFSDDLSQIKSGKANDKGYGLQTVRSQHQKLYPYQSRTETLGVDIEGVSRSVDSTDFWTGSESDIWANSDVYEIQSTLQFDIDTRQDDLLTGPESIQEWKTDLFGNNFALHKDVRVVRRTQDQVDGTLSGSSISSFTSTHPSVTGFEGFPVTYFNHQPSNRITIYETLNETVSSYQNLSLREKKIGKLYHRDFNTDTVNSLSGTLSAVFIKYTGTDILDQINDNITGFDIIDNVIILRTTNYVVVERYDYDFHTKAYKSLLSFKVFLSAGGGLEKNSDIWYDESEKEIYLCRTQVIDKFSNTYGKIIFPEIRKYNIDSDEVVFLNSSSGTTAQQFSALSVLGYSLSASGKKFNLTAIDTPHIKNNKSNGTFLVTTLATDQGDKSYILNYYFNSRTTPFTVDNISLLKPDINIYNLDVGTFPVTGVNPEDAYQDEIAFTSNDTGFEFIDAIPGLELSGAPGVNGIFSSSDNIIKMGTYFDTDDDTVSNAIDLDNDVAAPYMFNTSYLLYKLPLSATNRDIEVSFDIAVFNGEGAAVDLNRAYLRSGYATTEVVLEDGSLLLDEDGDIIRMG